jgi:aminoglycoside phosphotransferase (APT) family kinase protein
LKFFPKEKLMISDLQSKLEAYYSESYSDARIRALSPIRCSGYYQDIYSFKIDNFPSINHGCNDLILSIIHGGDGQDPNILSRYMYNTMNSLYELGYPIPKVFSIEQENSPFQKPFIVMEKIEGENLWSLLFHPTGHRQQELLSLFCQLLVKLHQLDINAFTNGVDYQDNGVYVFVDKWLKRGQDYIRFHNLAGFLPLVQWLRQKRDSVPCYQPSIIHGDFNPDNILLKADGTPIVLDWLTTELSDFRFDLAYSLVMVSVYQGMEWRDRILNEYESIRGQQVGEIEYFEIVACARHLLEFAANMETRKQRKQIYQQAYILLKEKAGIRLPEIEWMFDVI